MNTDFYKAMLSQLNDTQPYSNAAPYRNQTHDSYPMFMPGMQQQEEVANYFGLPGTEPMRPTSDFGGYDNTYQNPLTDNLDRSRPMYNDEMQQAPQELTNITNMAGPESGSYDPYGEY